MKVIREEILVEAQEFIHVSVQGMPLGAWIERR